MADDLMSLAQLGGYVGPPLTPDPQALAPRPTAPVYTDPTTWGRRYRSGDPKGMGFFGPLVHANGGVMSELSLEDMIDGKLVEYPSIVPTLTEAELRTLLRLKDKERPPRSVMEKALAFARARVAAGRSTFAEPGETRADRFPQLPRAIVASPPTSDPSLYDLAGLVRETGPR